MEWHNLKYIGEMWRKRMVNELAILRRMSCIKGSYFDNLTDGETRGLVDVEIRLNYKCNANCMMCGISNYIRKKGDLECIELKYNEWISVIDELKESGCEHITFSGGEPTIRKDLVQLVAYSSKVCGMKVSLNTNGYLLDEKMCTDLIDAGLNSVCISVLSPIAQINNSITGLKEGLSHISFAINYFKAHSSVKVFVNTVVLRNNIESFIAFPEWYEDNKFDYLTFSPASIQIEWDQWTSINESICPSVEQILYFKEKIIPKIKETVGLEKVKDPYENTEKQINNNLKGMFDRPRVNCYASMFHIVIQSNGDVIPCCYASEQYVMGNVREHIIKQIINSSKFVNFRKYVMKDKLPMCQSCRDYYNINKIISERRKINKMI